MKIRILFLLAAFGLLCGAALAQSTTVSVTVTDLSGQVWKNGTISYVFQPNPSYGGTYQWNGSALPTTYLTPHIVTLNGSGAGSFSVPTSTLITPAGSTWRYVVCPNASSPCTVINIAAVGSTQNISSQVTTVTPGISIQAGPMPLAYVDTEIMTTPNQGGIYFNVTSLLPKYYDGSAWQFFGGGGPGTGITNIIATSPLTGGGTTATVTINCPMCTYEDGGSPPSVQGIALVTESTTNRLLYSEFILGLAGTATITTQSSAITLFTHGVGTSSCTGFMLSDGTCTTDVALLSASNVFTGTSNVFTHNLQGATVTDGTCTMSAGNLGGCITIHTAGLIINTITGSTQCLQINTSGTVSGTGSACGAGGGGGTVTSVSSGNFSPLFNVSVATSTTTPAFTFTAIAQAANTVFGNFTGSPNNATFSASPVFSAAGLTNIPACSTCMTDSVAGTAIGQIPFITTNGTRTYTNSNILIDSATGNNITSLAGKVNFKYLWANPDGLTPTLDTTENIFVGNAVYNWTEEELLNEACGTGTQFPGSVYFAGTGNTENSLLMGHTSPCSTMTNILPDTSYVLNTGGVHQQYGTAFATVTNIALTSNVVTITASNAYSSGQFVLLAGLTTAPFLNGTGFTIITASSTQFTFVFTHANVSSSVETGVAEIITDNVLRIGTEGTGQISLGTSTEDYITIRSGLSPNGIFFSKLGLTTSGFLVSAPSTGLVTNATTAQQTITINSTACVLGGSCTITAGGAVSSVANSDGTLTISPTTGSVVASLALGHANTWTATQTNTALWLGTLVSGSSNQGGFDIGTLSFSDTNIFMSLQGSANSYLQSVMQNTNSGASASTDFIIGNDQQTSTTHFLDMGMNSSGFTGSGSLQLAGAGYVYSMTGDLVLGTNSANAIHIVYNNGTTDTVKIDTNGFQLPLIATSASTAVACFNGTNGALTNIGCAGVGTPAYPLTITGGVSGGVVYANSTTQLTVSATGTAGTLMLWGGAGAAPTASTATIGGTGTIIPTISGAIVNGHLIQSSGTAGTFVDTGIAGVNVMTLSGAQTATALKTFSAGIVSSTYATSTNCASSASPAVCGSAAAGAFTIVAATTAITVNTTAVTANSEIGIQPDSSLGTRLGVTCNTTLASIIGPVVTARSVGTSFTVTITGTLVTNPACYSYTVTN